MVFDFGIERSKYGPAETDPRLMPVQVITDFNRSIESFDVQNVQIFLNRSSVRDHDQITINDHNHDHDHAR